MLREAYLKAALPDRHTVMGVSLRPFAIGHQLLLERIRSPFAFIEPAKPEDLFIALLVCSQSHADAAETLNDPELPAIVSDFTKAILRAATRPVRWWQRPLAVDFAARLAAFEAYLSAARAIPEFEWNSDPNSELVTLGSHPLHVLKITLMSKLHFTEEQALNCPYALAHWNHATLNEVNGRLSLVDRQERAEAQADADAFWEHCRAGKAPQDFAQCQRN
jgi:hypothetical protein